MSDDHFVPGDPQTSQRSRAAFEARIGDLTISEIVAKLEDIGANGTPAMFAIPECLAAARLLKKRSVLARKIVDECRKNE